MHSDKEKTWGRTAEGRFGRDACCRRGDRPETYSLTHTQARLEACRAGARVATMPMITESMMRRGAMLADYARVKKLTLKLAKLLNKASTVEISTPAGTHLSFSVAGRKAYADTGIFHNPGDFGNLPAGEAFIAPVEGSAEGKIVVDGGMVGLPRGKLDIEMKRGKAAKVSGIHARELIERFNEVGRKAYWLAEFGVGTNQKLVSSETRSRTRRY